MTASAKKDIYSISYEDIFSGPIDLLLELIRKKKIDIYEVRLSFIIKGFADFIKQKGSGILDTFSSFIYFASLLLEIKSRSLLPSKKTGEPEPGELEVNILKRRERQYRTYRKVSNYISSCLLEGWLYLVREAPMERRLMDMFPDFMEDIDAGRLQSTASILFSRMKMDLDLSGAYSSRSSINMAGEMERIKDLLSGKREISFRELSSVHSNMIDRIISFLSVLELYKDEEIEILQFESFGNIIIRSI